jgi:hypothetical protein
MFCLRPGAVQSLRYADEGRVSFQFHHEEKNWVRDRHTITTATKNDAAMEEKQKKGGKKPYVMGMTLPTNSQRHSDV